MFFSSTSLTAVTPSSPAGNPIDGAASMNVVHERIAKVFASRDGNDIEADNRPVPDHVQDRWEIGRSSDDAKTKSDLRAQFLAQGAAEPRVREHAAVGTRDCSSTFDYDSTT